MTASSAQARADVAKAALYAPELPWNVFTADELGPAVMQFCNEHEPYFRRWAEVWWENFQFLFGQHNMRWSKKYGFAVDFDFMRTTSPFNLKAWTNIGRPVIEALTSLLYSGLPEWDVETMDESSSKGKRFRKIYRRLLECYDKRLVMDKEYGGAAFIFAMFGNVGADVGWRLNAGRIMEVPRYRRTQAPVFTDYMAPNAITGGLLEVPVQALGSNSEPLMEDRWEPVRDATGRQVVDQIWAGDAGVDILTPFEYRRGLGTAGMHKTPYAQRYKLLDYDEWLDQYGQLEGRTKHFKDVRPVYSNTLVLGFAQRLFMRMLFTTPPSLDDGMRKIGSVFKGSLFKHKVLVVEHFDRPHPTKWKKGRRLVITNGVCTHITAPSYNTGKLDGWHPLLEAQWMHASPSSVAPGPMNDVIRKNRELNVKDSLIASSIRRNMGSQLLIKSGSGLDPQRLTGEPGIAHEVSDPYGVRWLHDEIPIPPVVAQLRQADKDDVYETSGALDALRGQPSTGATSGYQEKQRQEREERRLAPARKNFELFVAGIGEKLACCIRWNAKSLDEYVVGFLKRSAAGEFTEADIVAFLSTPVDYGVDIKVVKSSMALKSKATQQATLQELAGGPLGQRLSSDAKVLDEYLKFFDVETLRDNSGPHRDRAERENETFLDMLRLGADLEGVLRPLVLFEDDDDIHMAEHTITFIKHFDEFRNDERAMLEFLTHQEHHRLQKQEKLGQVMPGTALQTANMMAGARQTATPTMQTIYMDSSMRQQQKAQQQAQPQPGQQPGPAGQQQPPAASGQQRAPQAPRQPAGPGGGPGKVDANAPSGNTPSARTPGAPS